MWNTNWAFKSWHAPCRFSFTPPSFFTASGPVLSVLLGVGVNERPRISCLDHGQSGTQTDRWFMPESQRVAAIVYPPSSTAPVWTFCSGWFRTSLSMGGAPLWALSELFSSQSQEFTETENVTAAHAERSYYDNPAHHHGWPHVLTSSTHMLFIMMYPPHIPVIITVCKLSLCHGWIAVVLALNSREKEMDFLLIN